MLYIIIIYNVYIAKININYFIKILAKTCTLYVNIIINFIILLVCLTLVVSYFV